MRTVALCSSSESGIAAGPLVTRPRKVSASVGISPCTDYLIVLHTPASGIDRAAERPLRLGEIQLTCRDDGINLAGGLFGLGRIFGVVCGPGAVPRLQSHHAPAREKDEEAPPSKAQCQSSASLRCSQETQDSKALAGERPRIFGMACGLARKGIVPSINSAAEGGSNALHFHNFGTIHAAHSGG